MAVNWNFLFFGELLELAQADPFVEPEPDLSVSCVPSHASAALSDHNLFASGIDGKLLQRPWRRSFDVLPVKIKVSVVAGTPDMTQVTPVLNNTGKVRAHCRKGPQLTGCGANQNSWLAAKSKNLARARLNILGLYG
jgi:hypothetical protein